VTNLNSLRPTSAFVMAGCVFLLDMLFLVQVVFYGDGQWFTQITLIVASLAIVWILFIHPKVEIFDEGITVVNPFITATIGWAEVDEIETRFALTIYSGRAKVVAFAAPAPGRYQARTIHKSEFRGVSQDKDFGVRPGDSPRTHSGAAAHIARTKLQQFRSAGGQSAKRSGRFNVAGTAVLLASAILVILGQVIHF